MESANKFTIRKLISGDIKLFQELIFVFEDVFEMQNFTIPDQTHLQYLLDKSDFITFAVLSENKVIGGLTAHVLTSYYFQSPDVYIQDLAVKTEFQRKKLGTKLMKALLEYCKKQNIREVFVQADAADQHAVSFYYSLGGKAEKAVNFDYLLI